MRSNPFSVSDGPELGTLPRVLLHWWQDVPRGVKLCVPFFLQSEESRHRLVPFPHQAPVQVQIARNHIIMTFVLRALRSDVLAHEPGLQVRERKLVSPRWGAGTYTTTCCASRASHSVQNAFARTNSKIATVRAGPLASVWNSQRRTSPSSCVVRNGDRESSSNTANTNAVLLPPVMIQDDRIQVQFIH